MSRTNVCFSAAVPTPRKNQMLPSWYVDSDLKSIYFGSFLRFPVGSNSNQYKNLGFIWIGQLRSTALMNLFPISMNHPFQE